MRTKKLLFAVMALTLSVMIAACGGSKNVADRKKVADEECEKMALEKVKGWRDVGIGKSADKSFAKNLADLDARTRLARQLEVQINSLISAFRQQYATANTAEVVNKSSEVQEGYADQLLINTKPICSNTYMLKDGTYEVYVCLELDEEVLKSISKQLTADEKISIDFAEHQFKKEMEKAKEDYRNRR